MIKKKHLLLCTILLLSVFSYGQDGRSLLLIHNYANKTAIDAIANPSDGNIAYNTTDKSFYLYDAANNKWIVDAYYKAITTTTDILTLDDSHYTVIIEADTHAITLPTTADYNGREYVLKNTTSGSVTITGYLDNSNTTVTTIPSYNVLKVQSDGANWLQVNNYTESTSSTMTSTTSSGTSCLNDNPPNTFVDNSTSSFANYNYKDIYSSYNAFTTLTPHQLNFAFTNAATSGSTLITEVQIIIRDVPYEILTPQDSTYSGGGTILADDIDVESGASVSGNSHRSDHIITITGISLDSNSNHQVYFNFLTNKNGFSTGGNTCNGCSIEYYTN